MQENRNRLGILLRLGTGSWGFGDNTSILGIAKAILGILVCFDTDSKKLFVVRGFGAKMSVNLTCKILGFM